ncbi:MAG: MBL fold metallo-hydrolase [Bacteroidales bacterium]|nr:MBL fold metallo-hydrolase [Bacteroidales bacterium]
MPRYSKKRVTKTQDLPSLFDTFDTIDFGLPEPKAIELPGLDRHVRNIKSTLEARRAATPVPEAPGATDRVLFISFGSGSSGNSAYIGTRDEGLLIDAGVDQKFVKDELMRNGISPSALRGIIVTHDHGDHVRYAYGMLRQLRTCGLYCTPRTLNGILRRHSVSRRLKDFHHAIYKEIPFQLAGFEITPFEVDHDGTDNVGYHITRPGFNFTIATDLGRIGERADFYLRRAEYIMIESNYDLDMLRRGTYPEYLKARIIGATGHLDNAVTAAYLASIYRPELKYVMLCHLSHDNNTPDVAVNTITESLAAIGVTVGDGSNSPLSLKAQLQVRPLPRFDSTGLITFRL